MFFISNIIPNDTKTKFNSGVLHKNTFNMELTQEEKKEIKSIKNKYLMVQGLSFLIAFL